MSGYTEEHVCESPHWKDPKKQCGVKFDIYETDGIGCEACEKYVCADCRCDRDEYYTRSICNECADKEDKKFRAERKAEKREKARKYKRRMLRRLAMRVPA